MYTLVNCSAFHCVEAGFERIPPNDGHSFELSLTYPYSVSGHPTLQVVLLFETKLDMIISIFM